MNKYEVVTKPISRKSILKGWGAIWVSYLRSPNLFGASATFRVAFLSSLNLFKNLLYPFSGTNASNDRRMALLTMTINPDLARLWYLFADRAVHSNARIVIVDSSGQLRKEHFPNAQIIPLWNFSHSRKIDYIVQYLIKNHRLWICDDDVMVMSPESMLQAERMMEQDEKTAAVSFIPNDCDMVLDGHSCRGMGSYCFLIDRSVFLKEQLSFSPVRSDNIQFNRGTGYYDTADYANEQLLRRGYNVGFLLDQDDEYKYVCGLDGVDSARIRLLDGKAAFEREIKRVNVRSARHILVGAYCNWKVVELYRYVFNEEPAWLPPVSIQDLHGYVEALGDYYVHAIGSQFALYDERTEILKMHSPTKIEK